MNLQEDKTVRNAKNMRLVTVHANIFQFSFVGFSFKDRDYTAVIPSSCS